MNTDELRSALSNLADEEQGMFPGSGPDARLAGVVDKVRVSRRRRLAGATVASLVVVAGAVTFASGVLDRTSPTIPTSRPADPRALDTVRDHGVLFYKGLPTDRLVAHTAAAPGAMSATLSFVPPTSNIALTAVAAGSIPPRLAAAAGPLHLAVLVNGHRILETTGQDGQTGPFGDTGTTFGSTKAANARAWAGYGLVPGHPSAVAIRVSNLVQDGARRTAQAAALRHLQLALAVYTNDAPHDVGHGVELPRLRIWEDRLFELVGVRFASVVDGQASVDLAAPHPGALVVSSGSRGVLPGPFTVTRNGITRANLVPHGVGDLTGGGSGERVERLSVHGVRKDGGVIFVAIYQPQS